MKDTRFTNLKDWYETYEIMYEYGSVHPQEKNKDRNDTLFVCYYDKIEAEPDWMKSVGGQARMDAYNKVIYGRHYDYSSSPAQHFKNHTMFRSVGLSFFNIAAFIGTRYLPSYLEKVAYIGMIIINIPIIAYTGHIYYRGLAEEQKIETRIERYKDKSMEYILRKAAFRDPKSALHKCIPSDNKEPATNEILIQ